MAMRIVCRIRPVEDPKVGYVLLQSSALVPFSNVSVCSRKASSFDIGRWTLSVGHFLLLREHGQFSRRIFRAREFLLADSFCHSADARFCLRSRISGRGTATRSPRRRTWLNSSQ